MNKRTFLKNTSLLGLSLVSMNAFGKMVDSVAELAGVSTDELPKTRNTTELRMKVGSKPRAFINLF